LDTHPYQYHKLYRYQQQHPVCLSDSLEVTATAAHYIGHRGSTSSSFYDRASAVLAASHSDLLLMFISSFFIFLSAPEVALSIVTEF